MSDLFADAARERLPNVAPLALRLRPERLEEFVGQRQVVGEGSALARAIADEPRLSLRGLMAIPAPHPDIEQRRAAFRAMKALFDTLATQHPQVDTLSMGMSDDIELAVAEGATMVRVGTALFGARESAMGNRES